MADDRPVEETVDQLATLQSDYDDFKSTMLARVARRPTGDIEQTLRTTAKADTLLLQGQAVSRTTYAGLWQWANDNSLTGAGTLQFGPGDGLTTFTLPNYAGRFLVGSGTLSPDAYTVGATGGASARTLVAANIPDHDHKVAVATHGNHGHNLTGGSVPGGGGHGGHNSGSFGVAAGGDGATAGNGNTFVGDHGHGAVAVFADANSAGSHTVTDTALAAATGFDNRPPFAVVNVLIWI